MGSRCSRLQLFAQRDNAATITEAEFNHVTLVSMKKEKKLENVLIIRKSTRWCWERESNPLLSDDELKDLLRSNGADIDELLRNEEKQVAFVENIIEGFKQRGVTARVVALDELADLLPADLVIAAGGDGTYLAAASKITGDTPLVGINSDPAGSEGHLCVGGKNPPPDLLDNLVTGNVEWKTRTRIRVRIESPDSPPVVVLGLNEAFIADEDASKVSTYDLSIDGSPKNKQKSSGILVSTGTGSTAWLSSVARMDDGDIERVVAVLNGLGVRVPAKIKKSAANMVNKKIAFAPSAQQFFFLVREPIKNTTFKIDEHDRGYGKSIDLDSRMTNGMIVLDGSQKFPFGRGHSVNISIDESDRLISMY